jgi:1-deoxy-D-xylulose-5-phosphate synthase
MKKEVESFISSVPRIGGRLMRIAKRAEDSLITLFTPGMLFEGLGFNYVGPIDGHDVSTIIRTLKDVEELKGPVLIHALTTKGKGFAPAEQDPALFHGIGKFDRATGAPEKSGKRSYTDVFSSALVELASKDRRVVAITAAMPEGTGLATFAKKFPDRFFDVGIAEQHAVTFAGGLAKEGFLPVTAIYSTFLQRAYDEVFHDVCLQGLPVIFALDRAGIVGADGPTHHGLFDIAYLRHLPGMVVTAPKDEAELRLLLLSSAKYGKPVSIRYPRGACLGVDMAGEPKDIPLGKGELIQCGKDVTIVALGTMVEPAMEAAKRLEKSGTDAGVVNARFVKPLDEELIIGEAVRTGKVLTVEEGALQGGFGSAVMELFEERGLNVMVKRLGAPDRFIEHGGQTELLSELGLDANGIEAAARALAGSNETKRKIAY